MAQASGSPARGAIMTSAETERPTPFASAVGLRAAHVTPPAGTGGTDLWSVGQWTQRCSPTFMQKNETRVGRHCIRYRSRHDPHDEFVRPPRPRCVTSSTGLAACSSDSESQTPTNSSGTRVEGDAKACEGQGIPEIGCAEAGVQPVAKCNVDGAGKKWQVSCPPAGGDTTPPACTPTDCGPQSLLARNCGATPPPAAICQASKGKCTWQYPECPSLLGNWGGPSARLDYNGKGATWEFDCGHGTSGPIEPDAQGNFSTQGEYFREVGPEPVGGFPSVKATYKGNVQGDAITFTFDAEGSPDSAGPFTVRRGTPETLHKCK